MSKPKNIKSLETGSGIKWSEWLELLEPHSKLEHAELAKVALEKINQRGDSKNPEWWAQGVTIAYEQHIGRRQVGQRSDGKFSVTVSQTFDGDMDSTLKQWQRLIEGVDEFSNIPMSGSPRISQTDKWRYWKVDMTDGSKISVNIQEKPGGAKSILSINHDKLPAAADVETWRAYWKELLASKQRGVDVTLG